MHWLTTSINFSNKWSFRPASWTSSANRKSSRVLKFGHQGSVTVGHWRLVDSEWHCSERRTLACLQLLGWYSVRISSMVALSVTSAGGAASLTSADDVALKWGTEKVSWRESDSWKGFPLPSISGRLWCSEEPKATLLSPVSPLLLADPPRTRKKKCQ